MIDEKILEKVCNQLFKERETILETGFKELDTLLGYVEKGGLITIGSRPSMGKTAFMMTVMENLLEQGKKCLFFSLEYGEIMLIKRLLGQIAEIDQTSLRSGKMPDVQSAERFAEALNKLQKYDLTIFDNVVTPDEINKNVEQQKPDFVFIDYLQLMEVPLYKSRLECYEKVMSSLKQIALENNCIIFITSQLLRDPDDRKDKRPQLLDLRKFGLIRNISDVIMFVYREGYYDFEANKEETEIIIAKNKYGACGSFSLTFKLNLTKFFERIHHAS